MLTHQLEYDDIQNILRHFISQPVLAGFMIEQ